MEQDLKLSELTIDLIVVDRVHARSKTLEIGLSRPSFDALTDIANSQIGRAHV